KIVGQILLDQPLSYALTATVDVPVVYLQQFWRTFPVETPDNPFVIPVSVDKKEAIQYPRFINLIIADLMNKFLEISKRIKEDYHYIKDDVPLVSMYTTGDVHVRMMLIPDAFLTKEIHATNDFKESTPRAHRIPTLTASPQGKKRKQSARESSSPHKSLKITIRQQKIVEGNKDDDDFENRLEPGSHKDKPKYVDDDDDKGVEKVDEEDGCEMGSLETRTEET
nr:hypothetical protein [Tanacetum cinerariifolium]